MVFLQPCQSSIRRHMTRTQRRNSRICNHRRHKRQTRSNTPRLGSSLYMNTQRNCFSPCSDSRSLHPVLSQRQQTTTDPVQQLTSFCFPLRIGPSFAWILQAYAYWMHIRSRSFTHFLVCFQPNIFLIRRKCDSKQWNDVAAARKMKANMDSVSTRTSMAQTVTFQPAKPLESMSRLATGSRTCHSCTYLTLAAIAIQTAVPVRHRVDSAIRWPY